MDYRHSTFVYARMVVDHKSVPFCKLVGQISD